MRNALIAIGVIVGGTALFLGSTFGILAFQGKLEGDSLRSLKKTPIMGSLLPEPEPLQKPDPESDGETGGPAVVTPSGRASKPAEGNDGVPKYINAPEAFDTKELDELLDTARDNREQLQNQWAALEVEKLNLKRLREDLEERKAELERTMGEVATAKSELEAAREQFRKMAVSIEDSEERMIRKLAEMYENMKDTQTAAQHFDSMEMDQAVKILVRMDAAKAAKILAEMSAEKVKVLTEKISRFQDRKKSTSRN
jgi:flagellar motility protein MotE (MotC chaperone)